MTDPLAAEIARAAAVTLAVRPGYATLPMDVEARIHAAHSGGTRGGSPQAFGVVGDVTAVASLIVAMASLGVAIASLRNDLASKPAPLPPPMTSVTMIERQLTVRFENADGFSPEVASAVAHAVADALAKTRQGVAPQ